MKTPLLSRLIFTLLLFTLICFSPFTGYSQSSSSNAENTNLTIYKFSVEGVINQIDADLVIQSFLINENITSAKFIDEADCFKITSTQSMSYESLRDALAEEGFILSAKVILSDGSIIREKSTLTERD